MSVATDTIVLILHRLTDYGIRAAVVGGAARDIYLGRQPKDYDITLLSYPEDALASVIHAITGSYPTTPRIPSEGSGDSTGAAEARGLEQVFSVEYQGLSIQFIQFTPQKTAEFHGEPWAAVMEHDCDLNKAWLEQDGDTLRARVADDFPAPGGLNTFAPDTDLERKYYIMAKFPEYHHKL